jgi:hypothetical protein
MTDNSIEERVAAARAGLAETLEAIDDKLNVPKKVNDLAAKAKSSYEANPLPWIIGAVGAAVVVAGLVAWAVLSDDD